MIIMYRVLTTLIYPLLFIYIYYRKILKKEDTERYKEKILISHFNVKRKMNTKLIWFHAASIGELKSIIPIINELNINKNFEFLITTITLSSSNLAKEEFKDSENIQHRFFPFDVGILIENFLLLWKPNKIFLVDSEIWPNLILKAHEKKIPIAIINARLTTKTYRKWMVFQNTAIKIFRLFDLCLTSNLETKNYLEKLHVKKVFFNGNIKLINNLNKNNTNNLNEEILQKKRFWLAASTHDGEEIFCLKTHLKLKEKYKDIITFIAPRHINRVKDIDILSKKLNLSSQILNKNEKVDQNKEIIIINSFGVLQDYFKYAKSTFIGKSVLEKLKHVGGQNPIDAAKLGCKIYHGPFVYNFKEIYDILKKNKISVKIDSYDELSNNLIQDLKNPLKEDRKIADFINRLGEKTLDDTMKYINNFLFNEIK